ncbi:MAG: ATP-binding protein, partial [Candidatus Methanomethylicota archaeon]
MRINDLIRLNPWWNDPSEIENDSKVIEALSKSPAKTYSYTSLNNTILLGPRQVGKTTYLKLMIHHLIKHKVDPRCILYFSCELLERKSDIIDLINTYNNLFSNIPGFKYILLDEITFVNNWEAAVKYLLDTWINKNNLLYVTGSSSIWLFKGYE